MEEFRFSTKFDQTILLGRRARNVKGLLEEVRAVPDSCIYYHTHRFLEQHHYLSPEPPNDFAYWVTQVLGDDGLGEQLSSVDIVQFESIAELRKRIVEVLEENAIGSERQIDCPHGEDFHFMASRTFVVHTHHVARTLPEFHHILSSVSINSVYYHMFDARLRLARGENDFSQWFRDMGKIELAETLKHLDPYRQTLEGLRERIVLLVRKYDTT